MLALVPNKIRLNSSFTRPTLNKFNNSDYYHEDWPNEKYATRPPDQRGKEKSLLSLSVPLSIGTSPVTLPSTTSTPSPVRSSIMIATATVGIPLIANPITTITSSPSFVTSYTNGHSSSPGVVTSLCPSPVVVHQTPIKSRDIGEDMEAIRLSRQDNPYLQLLGRKRVSLMKIYWKLGLVNKRRYGSFSSQSRMHQDNALTLSEVHEHLIRSPPPTSVPKTVSGKGIFIFPAVSSETTEQQGDFLDSSTTNSRIASTNLNPVISRGHEDVLDQHLRQLDII
ncbi:hypothetical protein Avbf_05178 [Armadillidium vulgare]|nr:hypothetical protein Avbf_05178 [Armadillidium vulgare]